MAAGFTTGAILGGVLTDLLSWRWAFFINVAVAAGVLRSLAPGLLSETRPARRPTLDVPGAMTVTSALLAVVYGLTQAGSGSWSDMQAYGSLLLGLRVAAGLFWTIEKRVTQPLVPIWFMRRPAIRWANLAGLLAFATETSVVFLLTLYLQKVLGYSPLAAGLSFAVLGIGTVLGGVLGPRVIGAAREQERHRRPGFVVQAVATVPLVFLGHLLGLDRDAAAGATFVGGIANLVAIVGFMVTATSGLPDDEQGLATGSGDDEPAGRHRHGHSRDVRHRHHAGARPRGRDTPHGAAWDQHRTDCQRGHVPRHRVGACPGSPGACPWQV